MKLMLFNVLSLMSHEDAEGKKPKMGKKIFSNFVPLLFCMSRKRLAVRISFKKCNHSSKKY